jgi:hypothetical protein
MFDVLFVDQLVRLAQALSNGSRRYARFRTLGKGSRILAPTGENYKVLALHAQLLQGER